MPSAANPFGHTCRSHPVPVPSFCPINVRVGVCAIPTGADGQWGLQVHVGGSSHCISVAQVNKYTDWN